jgi:hypothetical protein
MTREEIIEQLGIDEPVYFFDPAEVYDKGILGISEDHKHIIYGYYTLATAIAEDFEKTWRKKEHEKDEEEPDFMLEAFEWIDANTTPTADTIALHADNYPIMIYELTHEE